MHRIEEYKAVRWYSRSVIAESYISHQGYELKHVASASHVGGQRKIGYYCCDCYYNLKHPVSAHQVVIFLDYHGYYFHGHNKTCKDYQPDAKKEHKTMEKKIYMDRFLNILRNLNDNVSYFYVEIWSCDFKEHIIPYHDDDILIEDYLGIRKNLSMSYKDMIKHILKDENSEWLESPAGKIPVESPKGISGFLVLYGGKVPFDPVHGQLISKCHIEDYMLSDCQRDKFSKYGRSLNEQATKVVASNSFQGVHVMHSATYRWICRETGWIEKPKMLHVVLFKNGNVLSQIIHKSLKRRQEIKHQMKHEKSVSLHVRSLMIKNEMCGSFGYGILNLNKSGYTRSRIIKVKKGKEFTEKLKLSTKYIFLDKTLVKIYSGRSTSELNYSPLSVVGASSLSLSKLVLLDGMNFLNRHMDPSLYSWLYTDTDSIHCVTHHKNLDDNVAKHLLDKWKKNTPGFFDDQIRVSGMLILEETADYGVYFGEKIYQLFSEKNDLITSGTKGIPKSLATKLSLKLVTPKALVTQTRMTRKRDVGVLYQKNYKMFGDSNIPTKRKFMNNFTCSIPLEIVTKQPNYILMDK